MNNNSIRQRSIISALLCFSLISTGCTQQEEKSTATAPQAVPVKLATLQPAKLIDSDEFVGTLEATQRVQLAPKINGRIINIFVEEGEVVTEGQLVAELEPTQQEEDVYAATANIQSRFAAYQQAEAQLRQIQAERDSTSAQVARLKADVASTEANVKSAEADLQRAIAELDLAQVNYDRSKFLVESGVVPQQDLDNKTRDLNAAKASVEAQRKVTDAFNANVQATKESLNAANSNLVAAEERIQGAKSNVERAKADVAESRGNRGSIKQNLIYNRIAAPISGFIGDFKEKKVGDYLNTGESLTTITDNSQFHLNINVPIEKMNVLRMGLPVEMIKTDGTQTLKGSITYIAPLVNNTTQVLNAKVTFNNDGSLRDEQYVRVRVIWDTQPGVLIPTSAVSSLGGQKFVFVATQESKDGETGLFARQVPVKVGRIQGQEYQVISGVNPGDKIAVSRILDLRDNTPIREDELTTSSVNPY